MGVPQKRKGVVGVAVQLSALLELSLLKWCRQIECSGHAVETGAVRHIFFLVVFSARGVGIRLWEELVYFLGYTSALQ